jgi:phosphoglycolate phosphatase
MIFPLRVSAVTIDLDGTLLDTIPDLAAASNAMLEELGRAPLDVELIRTFVGKGVARLVERTLDAADVTDAATRARAHAVFDRHYEALNGRHTTRYPGVTEGLDALRAGAIRLACITNKPGRFTIPLLEMAGLSTYFETVVAGDTLPQKKPHPAPLLHASQHFGIAPGEMLMIGDSVNDAQAARAAGCPVFCVTYGYNEGGDVRDLDTDAIVDSLAEAARLVVRL